MAREYSPELKATVMAAVMGGQSINSASSEYDVPRGTIYRWQEKAELLVGSEGVATVATLATVNKREEVKELLVELLIAQLKSQIAIAEHAADKRWLTLQRADSVAILAGVANDKMFRLLEALNGGGTSAGSESGSASD